jgi:UDPglucose--hexose-1-phosphate uridylyltransferase
MTNQHGEPLRLKEDPHRRLNALTNEWVLVSPHRATRPWQGEVGSRPSTSVPQYDPECYLCPGNARAGGARNPVYTSTFVFDNDFAALKPDVAQGGWTLTGRG